MSYRHPFPSGLNVSGSWSPFAFALDGPAPGPPRRAGGEKEREKERDQEREKGEGVSSPCAAVYPDVSAGINEGRQAGLILRLVFPRDCSTNSSLAVDKFPFVVHISPRMVGVVQVAEHQTVDLEVVGSRPITHP